MIELDKLIEEKKKDFVVDKAVLNKRVENRLVSYDNIIPPINIDNLLYKRERKYYSTLQALIIDSAAKLNNSYTLDTTNSKHTASGFTVTYIKGLALQKKDFIKLKQEEISLYEVELNEAKNLWISDLTANLAKEAELEAVVIAQTKTKAIQDELTALLSAK
jgi:hypothetical protein